VWEYTWRVGEYCAERLTWDYWYWLGVVSVAETEFITLPPCSYPDNSTSGTSSADFSIEPILTVTMPAVVETVKSVIHKMIYGTDLKLVNMLQVGNVNLNTGKNDLTRHITHREAVLGPVIHSIFDAWHYDILWTCELTWLLWYTCDYGCLILYIMLHSIKLSNALHCTIPSKLWSTLLISLPACLTYAPQ